MARARLSRRIGFFVVHRILRTDDSPSRIARGVAIGVFMAFLPLMGLQMLLVLAASLILRANKLVGLPIVWISNPFTMGLIYYPGYLLGSALLRYQPVERANLEDRFDEIASLPWAIRTKEYAGVFFEKILYPTFIGSLIIGFILAIASYFLTVWAIRRHREHRIARRARRTRSLAEQIPDSS